MKFIVATNNKKKLSELQRILSPLGVEVHTAKELGFTGIDPEETGKTFAENAEIKAKAFCEHTGLPSIADDSGICVDALDGAPGVYSARYAGEPCDDERNIDKLLEDIKDVPKEKRTCAFVCSICCAFPNGHKLTAEGKCEGYVGYERVGNGGFGYDPVFMRHDGRSIAEYSDEEKDAISHRGNALREFSVKLSEYLKTNEV